MEKENLKDCCKAVKDRYVKLTPKQRIVADIGVGAVIGFGIGVVFGLLINKKRE